MGAMPLDNRLVLVTGAGGFIGGHLVAELVRRGASVRALVHYNSRNERGTLDWLEPEVTRRRRRRARRPARRRVRRSRRSTGADAILHLGRADRDPVLVSSTRATSSRPTCSARSTSPRRRCARGARRVVHTSTSEVYGTARTRPDRRGPPARAAVALRGQQGRGRQADGRSATARYELPMTIVRPFNTYGPRQSRAGGDPDDHQPGARRRDAAARLADPAPRPHVRRGHRRRASSPPPTPTPRRAHDPARDRRRRRDRRHRRAGRRHRSAASSRSSSTRRACVPAATEVERLISDPSLAQELTGWSAEVDLRDGLARTLDWIASNHAALPRQRLRHMRAVILAGGLGTRLRPYTTVIPKPLVPVGDRPILEHILRQLAAPGSRTSTSASATSAS